MELNHKYGQNQFSHLNRAFLAEQSTSSWTDHKTPSR